MGSWPAWTRPYLKRKASRPTGIPPGPAELETLVERDHAQLYIYNTYKTGFRDVFLFYFNISEDVCFVFGIQRKVTDNF